MFFFLVCLGTCLAQTKATPLFFRDVNVLAVTDVHAWLAGGDLSIPEGSPKPNADFGDLIDFVTLAKERARLYGKDVFLFDNGDVVDGTGISNIVPDHCTYLLPLLKRVPFDALNCGNHELYDNRTMEYYTSSGFIDSLGGRYLTSNLVNATTNQPLGNRWVSLTGPVSGVRLLVFGFMYNMQLSEGRCSAVGVVAVEEAVKSDWFIDALENEGSKADAIVLLAHMDADEPLIRTIVSAIREHLPHAVVQVIAGHSHMRKVSPIDERAIAYEPGNFFNTLGFASFDLPKNDNSEVTFHQMDLNTSLSVFLEALDVSLPHFRTFQGDLFHDVLVSTQQKLGLSKVLGCISETYQGRSLLDLYMNQTIPSTLFTPSHNMSQWFIQTSESLRYNIYPGNFTVDDAYKVLPFQDHFFIIHGVSGHVLIQLLNVLNSVNSSTTTSSGTVAASTTRIRPPLPLNLRAAYGDLPKYVTTNLHPSPTGVFDVIIGAFDVPKVKQAIENITKQTVVPAPFRPSLTDTLVMIQWGSKSLGKPCT